MRFLAAITVFGFLGSPALADVPRDVTARPEVYVVHLDPSSPAAALTALAAVPAAVRHGAAGVSQALLVGDDPENPVNVRLLTRWKGRVGSKGVERLVFVGTVAPGRRQLFIEGLGNPPVTVLEGDPETVSRDLAAMIASASPAREFPLPADAAGADLVQAANAAAAAAVEGRGLIYRVGGPAASARGPEPDRAVAPAARSLLDGTEVTTVCLVHKPDQVLPAAFAAAHYRGVVAQIPGKMVTECNQLEERVLSEPQSITKLETLPPRREELLDAQGRSARNVTDWMAAQGLDRPDRLETVMIFAKPRRWWFWGLAYTFDRQLVGSPLVPDRPGALVGRLPLDPEENLAVLNRSTLHRVLAGGEDTPRQAVLSFVAYEANHAGEGSPGPWTDNFGVAHRVNELVGIPGVEPGIHPLMQAASLVSTYNNGWDPAVESARDPLVGSEATGFYARLNQGATLFYSSSHGSSGAFYPFDRDRSIQADVAFGDPTWPSSRGRFTTMGRSCSAGELDRQLADVNGLVAIFNACLVANGNVGPNLLRHGARAVVSSYISVSFDGAGWWGIRAVESLAAGAGIGEAMAFGLAHTSEIFPAGLAGVDHTLRFVVMGDPHAGIHPVNGGTD